MRVLLIDVNYKTGSTGKIVESLYKHVRSQGDIAAVCYGRGEKISSEYVFKFEPSLEMYLHAFLSRVTGITGCYSLIGTIRLILFIEYFNPDVVHIHELHAYFVNIPMLCRYLKFKKIKTLWTFHCEFMYTGKCGNTLDCNRWLTGCGHCPRLGSYVSSWFFDFTHFMWLQKKKIFSDWNKLTIVCPSQWLALRCSRSLVSNVPIKVINNGVDNSVFYKRDCCHLRKKLDLKDEKIVLCVAPNLMSDHKGGKLALQFATRFQGENVKFIFVGLTTKDLDTFNFPKNVLPILKTDSQDQLAEFYSLSDIFISFSVSENYPTTCLEAVACGSIVCGFDVGGTKETFPSNPNNFVSYGDLDALENVVRIYLNGDSDCIEEHLDCSEQTMVSDYYNLYQNL